MNSAQSYSSRIPRFGLVVATVAAVALTLPDKTIVAAAPDAVRIETGLISGVLGEHDPGVRVFQGRPFAAPPMGSLRWRSPQPAPHWEGVREANDFAPSCPQPPPNWQCLDEVTHSQDTPLNTLWYDLTTR